MRVHGSQAYRKMGVTRERISRTLELREILLSIKTRFSLVNAAVEEHGTSGLVIEVFDYSNKVCADIVLLHGCPRSCMPNLVEGLLEVYEDMVEVLLVLEIFLAEDSCFLVLLPALKPACSSAMIFSACGFNLFSMIFSMTSLG